MELLEGYSIKGEHSDDSRLVCKLHKSLYGLKQASRQWNAKLTASILQYGFKQSMSDYSLFTMSTTGGEFVALLIYVDDILIASNSAQAATAVKSHIDSQFKLKDLGTVKYFLGLEVARSPQGISICQRKYILDLLEEYGLLGAKPSSTPIDYNVKLRKVSKEEEVTDPTKYRQLVGKLLYLTFTRPDICYVVQNLAQFMDKPTVEHHMAAQRVLKYLKGAPGQGILMKRDSNLKISAYCDSDWTGCPDTRKSVTGYCVFIGESLVAWKSKKQQIVARSSTEAEYRSMAATCCEVIWIKGLLADFGIQHYDAVKLYCDNQSSVYISKNPVLHERTKHIEIDCHFNREKVQSGEIEPVYIPTQLQVADAFTKPLQHGTFKRLLYKMNIHNVHCSS
ncbi:PREDICTED: uncharacterized mitochondrial protein AtMg00810-like [Theobroma cacao]|uniref:Uncharacterized mitochondrial protein AtMg00810-like n=1 Tax=Theobroma cacao TaxID=3641 RepID=A0AB32WNF3_THECC|nr:PREDICTED: uncharacterized mitochondrial protein AtMg00810-like [Theobroma cacao]